MHNLNDLAYRYGLLLLEASEPEAREVIRADIVEAARSLEPMPMRPVILPPFEDLC